MSEETQPIPLRAPEERKSEITFDVPHLLIKSGDYDGFLTQAIREGGPRQLELISRIEWTEAPVDEHDQVFVIRGRNVINFAGARLSILNDATEQLPPSAPTTAEYMAKRGTEVLIHFDCTRDNMESRRTGRDAYKVVRNSLILP